MPTRDRMIKYYLDQVAKYRREGESDEEADRLAERDTRKRFGQMPK